MFGRAFRPLGVVILVLSIAAGCGTRTSDFGIVDAPTGAAADYEFLIPAGSGEASDRGEPLEILPGSLDVKVGEILEIVNEDDRGHLVGPFFVGADETIRHQFSSPGEFEGICSVHPSGRIILTVLP